MDLYAKGQLSFLILNCLQERDFYGLDIISEICDRSSGRINLKKPSVYSNLTRMEKQGYVSAYLKNSDLGPNRKYYSITEKGRNFYKDLSEYFDRNNIDVFRDFADGDSQESDKTAKPQQIEDSPAPVEKQEEVTSEDYFDFSSIDSAESEQEEQTNMQEDVSARQNDYFSKYITTSVVKEQEESVENNESETENVLQQDNSIEENEEVLTETNSETEESLDNISEEETLTQENEISENAEDYNKRIYDISRDLGKFRRRKSFAEDQISMTVDSTLSKSDEKTNKSIQEFRNSIQTDREKPDSERINQYDFSKQMEYRFSNNQKQEEVKDDAKFITEHVETIQRPRKITPPRLKIVENTTLKIDSLPAPKRDMSIDPSHKEILSRLYSKTKDNNSDVIRDDAIYDYVDLKDYYNSQNIMFSEYKKPVEKEYHNTNKLYLILSLIVFFAASFISALSYVVIRFSNVLNPTTNFLFIVLPALFILDVIVKFYNFKIYTSWFPKQMLTSWKIWLMTLFLIGVIVGFNAFWGYGIAPFANFATTLILPIALVFVMIPIRYYLKRFLLVKFWK